MTEPEEAMLGAIADAPDDDAPRLAYAAWLAAQGESDRAEFIRIQVSWRDRNGRLRLSPNWPAIDRQGALLQKHKEAWLARYAQTYSGGFIDHAYVVVRDYPRYEEQWRRLVRSCTAELKPRGLSQDEAPAVKADYDALAACPSLAGWRHLVSDVRDVDPGGFLAILASSHLTHLRHLDAYKIKLRAAGAKALACASSLAGLSRLILDRASLGDQGAEALAASSRLQSLTWLELNANKLGDTGAVALAESPILAKLERLALSDNQIGDPGALALARSPYLGAVTLLFLDNQAKPLSETAERALRDRFGDAVCLEA
jgi:uncharacterized protein (TIGR02996 family)